MSQRMGRRSTRQRVNLNSSAFRRCPSQKAGFATKALALDAAERMMDQGKVRPGCHITPYPCEQCPEWHVANRIIVFLGRNQND